MKYKYYSLQGMCLQMSAASALTKYRRVPHRSTIQMWVTTLLLLSDQVTHSSTQGCIQLLMDFTSHVIHPIFEVDIYEASGLLTNVHPSFPQCVPSRNSDTATTRSPSFGTILGYHA